MKVYIFFGLPGSGKGTQMNFLLNKLNKNEEKYIKINTGDNLRKMSDEVKNTSVRKHLYNVLNNGGFVSSAFPIYIWVNNIINRDDYNIIVFDGVGRKKKEIENLCELLDIFEDIEINVIYIKISHEEALKRILKRKRNDDTEEVLRTRISLYEDEEKGTMGSVIFIKERNGVNFHEINGEGTKEEVNKRLFSKLNI